MVAPTLDNPACKEQVTGACREVGRAVQELVIACQDATDDRDLQQGLVSASGEVRYLQEMLDTITVGTGGTNHYRRAAPVA